MQDDQFYFACTCTAVTEVFSAELHSSWQIYDARENYIEILHNLCNVLSNSRFRASEIHNKSASTTATRGKENEKDRQVSRYF